MSDLPRPIEEEEEDSERNERLLNLGSTPRSGGAAIAPPPSLQESSTAPESPSGGKGAPSFGGGSVAAKIMAKFGYKVCNIIFKRNITTKAYKIMKNIIHYCRSPYIVFKCIVSFIGRTGSGEKRTRNCNGPAGGED